MSLTNVQLPPTAFGLAPSAVAASSLIPAPLPKGAPSKGGGPAPPLPSVTALAAAGLNAQQQDQRALAVRAAQIQAQLDASMRQANLLASQNLELQRQLALRLRDLQALRLADVSKQGQLIALQKARSDLGEELSRAQQRTQQYETARTQVADLQALLQSTDEYAKQQAAQLAALSAARQKLDAAGGWASQYGYNAAGDATSLLLELVNRPREYLGVYLVGGMNALAALVERNVGQLGSAEAQIYTAMSGNAEKGEIRRFYETMANQLVDPSVVRTVVAKVLAPYYAMNNADIATSKLVAAVQEDRGGAARKLEALNLELAKSINDQCERQRRALNALANEGGVFFVDFDETWDLYVRKRFLAQLRDAVPASWAKFADQNGQDPSNNGWVRWLATFEPSRGGVATLTQLGITPAAQQKMLEQAEYPLTVPCPPLDRLGRITLPNETYYLTGSAPLSTYVVQEEGAQMNVDIPEGAAFPAVASVPVAVPSPSPIRV